MRNQWFVFGVLLVAVYFWSKSRSIATPKTDDKMVERAMKHANAKVNIPKI